MTQTLIPLHVRPIALILLVLALLMTGCSDDSARVADVAQQALESQAEQNKELARLSGEVVESSQQLVEHDAQARSAICRLSKPTSTGSEMSWNSSGSESRRSAPGNRSSPRFS